MSFSFAQTGKSVFAALCVVCMVAGVAACGGGGSSASSNSLTISWWGNQQRNDRTNQINQMFTSSHDGVKIDGQFSEYSDYWQKLATNAAGKTMPDVMQMDVSYLNQYVENGLLLDLSTYVNDGTLDISNVEQSVVDAGKVDGTLYALTNSINAPAMIYDKALLDSIGVTVPDDLTVDKFMDIAREVYEKTGMKTNFRYGEPTELLEYILRGEGKQLFDTDKLGVDSASELEPYFSVYETGIKEGWHVSPEVFAELKASSVEQDPLVYGTNIANRSWCTFKYTSMLGAYQKAAQDGQELAMAPYPAANQDKANYIKPSQYWVISKTCKNPKLAAEWINFYTNDIEANKILLTDRGIPISSKVVEGIKDSLSDSDQAAIDFIDNVVTPHSSTINPPVPAKATEINAQTLPQIEEQLCYGKITASEAAEQFFTESNSILG